jgi:hypothetical protein
MDRAAAYRAAVDAVYRQYAIDHGYARMEILERETFTPAMRSKETEDPEEIFPDPASAPMAAHWRDSAAKLLERQLAQVAPVSS